jgi:mannose-1-phosphate guanylyltransferase/mannose-6-phosphate isomerase
MKAVVLAGGRGTRLWPLSRVSHPKQFLKLGGGGSLLQETVRRVLHVVGPGDVVVMTNADFDGLVRAHVQADLGPDLERNIVLEPAMRNTAPALALAAVFCRDRLGARDDEVLFVCPSDHVIRPVERFADYMRRGAGVAAKGRIVTFGIRPTGPETGYGYIEAAESDGGGAHRVERFTEKPDLATARAYVETGRHYWNSGMFAFRIDVLMDELRRHAPAVHSIAARGYGETLGRFADMPDISIDYAVMERSDRVVTLPMKLEWSDIGSWDAVFDLLDSDVAGNAVTGDVLVLDAENNLIWSDERLVTAVGVSNLLVVETADAVLIARRGEAERVKEVVERLREVRRPEASEHRTVQRPWGSFHVLENGDGYKVKRLVVNPGEMLSLQTHRHRSEHWVVVRGTARVTIGDAERTLTTGATAFVPQSAAHRIANPGEEPLEIIEVQRGDYLGEDDIVRHEDVYGRA